METKQKSMLERMLDDRATWEEWTMAPKAKPTDRNLPVFRVDGVIDGEPDWGRYQRLSDPTGCDPQHYGCKDTQLNRHVVLRKLKLEDGYSSAFLWEFEIQKNQSHTWDRYRALNRRFTQRTVKLHNYKVKVEENGLLGLQVQHFGEDPSHVEDLRVGHLVIEHAPYHGSANIWRVTGRRTATDDIYLAEFFTMSVGHNENKKTAKRQIKSLRLVTMSAAMDWILRLKLILREVGQRGY